MHSEHKTHDDTPLHKQAAIIRPVPLPRESIVESKKVAEVVISAKNNDEITLVDNHAATTIELAKVETDLVNALEKLVKLQQQGFLTADEFEQAKAKLYHFK